MILHGDLHHENILYSTEHSWLAIDPKGLCGDPGYEVATFMLNQLPLNASRSTLRQVLARRVSIFSDELKMERQRLAKWSFCHAALSAAWSFEEGAEHKGTIFIAQVLEDLIREKLNPFGHTDVTDPTAYVRTLRRKSRETTDEEFLADLKRWEKIVS